MCLYLNIQDPCSHSECQIALSIYKSSESYTQNGLSFPRLQKQPHLSELFDLPPKLQLQNTSQNLLQLAEQQTPLIRRDTLRTISSKSSVDNDREGNTQMLKIMRKMQKEIRELKKNQMMIIMKMQGMEREWQQIRNKD